MGKKSQIRNNFYTLLRNLTENYIYGITMIFKTYNEIKNISMF